MKRGFSPDAGQSSRTTSMHSNAYPGGYTDPVMAEYITIMIINNKTAGTSMFLPDFGHFTLVAISTNIVCHYSSNNIRTRGL